MSWQAAKQDMAFERDTQILLERDNAPSVPAWWSEQRRLKEHDFGVSCPRCERQVYTIDTKTGVCLNCLEEVIRSLKFLGIDAGMSNTEQKMTTALDGIVDFFLATEGDEAAAKRLDRFLPDPREGEFYADYIEESGDWGVFHTETSFCFSTWSDERTAVRKAKKLQKANR